MTDWDGDDPAAEAAEPAGGSRAFDPRMLEALVCPQTHGPLTFDPARQELVSRAAHLAFPVRDGIPIMLLSEARALD
ncbi:Trm112 family protein [Rubellimicrobium sp. CFH 75288]|nr:Trm112 family protein [Rubellimicrobium sp. CFH 75288]